MSSRKHARPLISRALAAIGIVAATTAAAVLAVPAGPASAHGNVVDPAARNYSCLDRWGENHQAPEMATEDAMCYQAWQANPAAMWNWNGLFREGVAGNHQGAIPDGQLCSGGRTDGGRYNAMDAVGNWHATNVGNSFTLRLYDQASHGADYIRIYATRQGFNPITQPLRWSDLELVGQIGDTPAAQWDPAENGAGVQIDIPVSVSGRSGRHMLYTIWQASHLDQSYYFCSDVNFPGGTNPPTNPPTTPPVTPTTPPVTPTTPPAGSAGCTATYAVSSQWQGGFQANVTVTAGSSAVSGWQVTLTYPSGQTIQNSWNATVTASGSTVTATNVGYNGSLGAGGTASFGLIGSNNAAPTVSCSAT